MPLGGNRKKTKAYRCKKNLREDPGRGKDKSQQNPWGLGVQGPGECWYEKGDTPRLQKRTELGPNGEGTSEAISANNGRLQVGGKAKS